MIGGRMLVEPGRTINLVEARISPSGVKCLFRNHSVQNSRSSI